MEIHFDEIIPGRTLSGTLANQLIESGFVIVPGPIPNIRLAQLSAAYDEVMTTRSGLDSESGHLIRVRDFVNYGPSFDGIYLHMPLLEGCKLVIGEPFKLSSFVGRTLKPQSPAQALHADLPRTSTVAPMVGFILMVDAFRSDNGATRFVPTSQGWPDAPSNHVSDPGMDQAKQVLACGPAGSMIIFNAATWHGHTANDTLAPRRSIQGYFLRRNANAGFEFSSRIQTKTLDRISPLARYLLAV